MQHIGLYYFFTFLCFMSRYLLSSVFLLLILTCGCTSESPIDEYTYYDQGIEKLHASNYPAAMEAFLQAQKMSQETGNDSVSALTALAMMDLSDSICDYPESVRYALIACKIYERNNATDNIRSTLAKLAHRFNHTINPEDINELTHFASIIKAQDSLLLINGDSTQISWLHELIQSIYDLNFTDLNIGCGLKPFNPYNYIEQIKTHGNWQNEITNDSNNITVEYANLITTSLWEQGFDKEAADFIHFYRKYYKEKEMIYLTKKVYDSNRCKYRLSVKVKINEPNPDDPTFSRTFQDNVKSVVTKFHFDEELKRKHALRSQRILLVSISTISFAVILLIVMYSRLLLLRRRRIEDNNIRSASELKNALSALEDTHIKTLTHLCNTYYDSYNNESAKSKIAKDALRAITEIAENKDFFTRIEARLNESDNNLMLNFRREMTELKESDYKLFICNAIGLSIPAICLVLGEKRDVIYARRLRLRTKIQESDAIDKETFLNHLK